MTIDVPSALALIDDFETDLANGSKLINDPPGTVTLRTGDVVKNMRKRLEDITGETLAKYGALGDAATNDSTALKNAFEAASVTGAMVHGEAGKTYRIEDLIDLTARNINFDGHGCKFLFPTTGTKLKFTNGIADHALTEDYDNTSYVGTAVSATSTTLVLEASSAEAGKADDHWNDHIISLRDGTGLRQWRYITDYDTTTDTITVDPAWETTPDSTTEYEIHPSIKVADASLTIADGDPVVIASNAINPDDLDRGNNAAQYRMGEVMFVKGTRNGRVSFVKGVRRIYGISTTDSGDTSDESRVLAYTTGNAARLLVPDVDSTFSFRNVVFEYEDGHGVNDLDQWAGKALICAGYVEPVIEMVGCTRAYDSVINTRGTINAVVNHCWARNVENNTGDSQQGYGLTDGGFGTKARGCWWSNTRHGFNTNASVWETDETDLATIMGVIGGVGAVVSDCLGTGHNFNSAFTTHHGSRDCTFINCVAKDCGRNGFSIRGVGHRIKNPTVVSCQSAIYIQTEFSDTHTNDDTYVAGTLATDWTSCVVEGGTFSVDQEVFRVDVATARFTGHMVIDSGCQVLVGSQDNAASGVIEWDATATFTVKNNEGARGYTARNGAGVFHLRQTAQTKAQTPFPTTTLRLTRNADLTIDVKDSTSNNVFLFSGGTACEITQDGRVDITMPSNGRVAQSGIASITGDGLVSMALDGASDDANDHNLAEYDITVASADDSVMFYGPWPYRARRGRVFADYNLGSSVTGSTSENNLIAGTRGDQDKWIGRYVNAGDSLLFRSIGQRTGTAGTATIRVRHEDTSGSAVQTASFTQSATAGTWSLTAEYWLTATDTVNYLITYTDTDGTVTRATGSLSSYDLSDSDVGYLYRVTTQLANGADAVTAEVHEIEGTRGGGIY